MFDEWELGKYMDAAYKVSCEWYPDDKKENQKWILGQMQDLTEETTLEQAILDLLVNQSGGKFYHRDGCDYVDLDVQEDCVACHIVKAYAEKIKK